MKRFYLYRIFTLNHFMTAIYVIYLRSLGCSFVSIAAFHTAKDLTVMGLEIPLSYLSEKIGYKFVLALSGIFMTLSMLLMMVTTNRALLLLSFICWGIAVSCDSGISDAYLYEQVGEQRYPIVKSNTIMWRQLVGSGFKLIGSMVYSVFQLLPFLLTIVNSLISTGTALSFKPIKVKQTPRKVSFKQFKGTVLSPAYLAVVFHNVCLITFLSLTFTYESVLLVDQGLDANWLGVVTCLKLIVSSFGVHLVKKFVHVKNSSNFYLWLYVISTVAILGLGNQASILVTILSILVISIVNGVMFPYRTILLNKVIQDNRATLLSIQSQGQFLMRAVLSLVMSWIADTVSPSFAMVGLALLTLSSILIMRGCFYPIMRTVDEWNENKVKSVA